MTKIVVVSIILVFWISGSSYWYVCKVRNNCKANIQNELSGSSQKQSTTLPEKLATSTDSIGEMVPDSVQQLNAKILETENYLKETGVKMLYFDFASVQTVINETDRAYLEKIVFYLKQKPDKKLIINGYSDNIGTPDVNIEYSRLRANFVKDYLINLGTNPKQLEVFAKADSNAIASNETDEGRAKNRRVEIVISKL